MHNLKEILSNMGIGNVATVNFIVGDEELSEYIVKTNWFDTTIFILGGLGSIGSPIIVGRYIEDDIDIDSVADNITRWIGREIKDCSIEGNLDISYKAKEVFREGTDYNFRYIHKD